MEVNDLIQAQRSEGINEQSIDSASQSVTSREIEANWLEFLRASQLSQLQARDAYSHTCQDCGQKVDISGSAIRIAKSANSELNLPCGHTTSVPIP